MNMPNETAVAETVKNGKTGKLDASTKQVIDNLLSGTMKLDNGKIVPVDAKDTIHPADIDYRAILDHVNNSGMDKGTATPIVDRINGRMAWRDNARSFATIAYNAMASKKDNPLEFASHAGVTALVRMEQDAEQETRRTARKTGTKGAENIELSKAPRQLQLSILGRVVANRAKILDMIGCEIDSLATCIAGGGENFHVSNDDGKTKTPVIDAICTAIFPLKVDMDAKKAYLSKARVTGQPD